MKYFINIIGGIAGSMQSVIISGFVSDFFHLKYLSEFGSLFLIVPIGSIFGIISTHILLGKTKKLNLKKAILVWIAATIMGFPAAIIYPLFISGASDVSFFQHYGSFFIQSLAIWFIIFIFCLKFKGDGLRK